MTFSSRLVLSVAACTAALTALLAAQSSTGTGVRGWSASDVNVPVVQVQNDLSWG
ncbi:MULTISPECIES: hypothetical protein [unclassified Streptomyces]|uniref:hypothetical protein n=1 Tax=unclassified Streptomyces TaxID=2593676 RepID=UPI001E38048F|nr:hypothetical protein [Streptomyces sp. CB02980]MCB8908239.1 hypothetical protein [Streptomyces sp. CB02980]